MASLSPGTLTQFPRQPTGMGVARGRRHATCRERCLAHDGETANPGREDHASFSTPSLHGHTGVSCRAGMITCQSFPGCWAGFTFRLKSHGQRNTGPLSSSVLPLVRGAGFHILYTPRPFFLSCLSQPTWTLSSPPKGIRTQPSPTCLPTLAWVILTGSLGYPLLASRPHPTHCLFPLLFPLLIQIVSHRGESKPRGSPDTHTLSTWF